MIFLFPKNLILFFRRKMKDHIAQKMHGKRSALHQLEQQIIQQEVDDDSARVCVLNIIPKVSSLPRLLGKKSLVKICMRNEQIHFSNGCMTSCWSLDQRVMFGNLLHWVSTVDILVYIHFLQMELFLLFIMWPNKATLFRCHAHLWVRASLSMSPPWTFWWS